MLAQKGSKVSSSERHRLALPRTRAIVVDMQGYHDGASEKKNYAWSRKRVLDKERKCTCLNLGKSIQRVERERRPWHLHSYC